MPSIFKTLASIAVWALFVTGALALLGAFVRIVGAALDIAESPDVALMTAYFGYGLGGLVLSVITMWFRKRLE